ncbi:MAG: YeiH family protein [bacterium]
MVSVKSIDSNFSSKIKAWREILPGFLLAVVVGYFSFLFSEIIGEDILSFEKSPISPVMLAIIIGILVSNLISIPKSCDAGLIFSGKKVLSFGIVLLGFQLSLSDIFTAGLEGIPVVLGCIITGIIFTIFLSKLLGLPKNLGILIAVGTSICGVTAIVATGPIIRAKREEIAYAVSVITVFGILATIGYPYLANHLFENDPTRVGYFLGTAVHDTSQVTGSALLYADLFNQPLALEIAVITKLFRNICMILVLPLIAYFSSVYGENFQNESTTESQPKLKLQKYIPVFIIWFLLMATFRSLGDFSLESSEKVFGVISEENWEGFGGILKSLTVQVLVIALAAIGLNTRFANLKELGLKPFLAGCLAASTVGLVSYLLIVVINP